MSERSTVYTFIDQARVHPSQDEWKRITQIMKQFSALPYENVSKIIRFYSSPSLDLARRSPDEVITEHRKYHLGGTCFSLANTLRTILLEIDVQPWMIMGDMRVGKNVHCALLVPVAEGMLLLDPGYLLPEPLLVKAGETTTFTTPMNQLILETDPHFTFIDVFVFRRGIKKWRYRLHISNTPEETFLTHWNNSFYMNMNSSITVTTVTPQGQKYFARSKLHHIDRENRKVFNARGRELECIAQSFSINPEIVMKAIHLLRPKVGDYHHRETKKTLTKGEVGAMLPPRPTETKYGDVKF